MSFELSPTITRSLQPKQAAVGPQTEATTKTRIKHTASKTTGSRAPVQLSVPATNLSDDDDMEDMEEEGEVNELVDEERIEAAEKIVKRVRDFREPERLNVRLLEGEIHPRTRQYLMSSKINFIVLDFDQSKTYARNVMTFTVSGQAFGQTLTFSASLTYTEPKNGTGRRGSSSLYFCVADRHRNSDCGDKLKEFEIVRIVDRQHILIRRAPRKTAEEVGEVLFSEEEPPRNPKKSDRRGEDEKDHDGFVLPQDKKARSDSELFEFNESEKTDRSENNKIAPEVVNCMIWENKSMISEAGLALQARYDPIMRKLVNDEIRELALEQDWAGAHRRLIEASVRAEIVENETREAKAAQATWTADKQAKFKIWAREQRAKIAEEETAMKAHIAAENEKLKAHIAAEKAKAVAKFEAWVADKEDKRLKAEREAGREEMKAEMARTRIESAKNEAAKTPGLAEVDMSKPVSTFEKDQLTTLFSKPAPVDPRKRT